ncbi:MAG: dihydropteroate synthase [Venatoribacter sp.]
MILTSAGRSLNLAEPQVMGILNVTPDSFSDGGVYKQFDHALRHAQQMLDDGATIIDIGGESTRPGAQGVAVDEELERVIPLVEAIKSRLDVMISVDSSTAMVMREAAKAGAHLLNDVRSFTREGALQAAVESQLAICLMHMNGEPQVMQQNPDYSLPVEEAVYLQLKASIERCEQAGIASDKILIDPGFGFGKNTQHDYRLLKHLDILQSLHKPLLTGLSRKRMIGAATGQATAADRIIGSVSAAVLCVSKGACIVRVHDVKQTVEGLRVYQAMIKEGYV